MENLKSVLIFEKYIVDKVEFIRNKNCDLDQRTKVNFSVSKSVKKIEDKMEVTIETKIFEHAEENNYPFEMNVQITGFFAVENESKLNLEPNAIAILYPYIRAIVSTYTASANVNALTLPPINVNKLFDEDN